MRELTIRLGVEDLLESGFPYPGELSWGYRNGWIDGATLARVTEVLSDRKIPLCQQEEDMALLLKADIDYVDDLARGLVDYEDESSSRVWCYYVARHLNASVGEAKTKFELLDVAWADMEYPNELSAVLFPQEHHPAHIYVSLGQEALDRFLDRWRMLLLSRDPIERLGAGKVA